MTNKPQFLILHHNGGTALDLSADTSNHSFEDVNAWHKTLWPYFISKLGFVIGYHWYIDKQGKITQGRDETEAGAHVIGMNDKSIGICLSGNFDRLPTLPNSKPTDVQIATLKKLLKEICQRHGIARENIVGHRHFSTSKTCPGKNLTDDFGQRLLEEPKIEELQKQRLTLMQQIIETLKLLIIRWQNKLGGRKYD